jgi:hypothetical protein
MSSLHGFAIRAARMLLPCVAVLAPVAAQAWGTLGHEVVAEIAARQLTPQARAMVEQLLGDPAADALRAGAQWADEIRAYEGMGPTAPYHFVNFPANTCDFRPARDCPDGHCIVAAVGRFERQLHDARWPEARVAALKWVIHLVADIHQPLHAGRAADRGGNDFQLRWQGRGSNLHALLDAGLLESRGFDPVSYADALLSLPDQPTAVASRWDDQAAVRWAEQSCGIVDSIYPRGRRIGPDYVTFVLPLLERRLLLAGYRLAGLLNHTAALGGEPAAHMGNDSP